MKKICIQYIRSLREGESVYGEGLHIKCNKHSEISYYAYYMKHGVRVHTLLGKSSDGINLTKARNLLAQMRAQDPLGKADADHEAAAAPQTFEDAAVRYLEYLEHTGGKNIEQKRQQLQQHLVPAFKTRRPDKINTEAVKRYRENRRKSGIANSTINRETATLKHLYNTLSAELALISPAAFHIKPLPENNRRDLRFSDEQIDALLDAAASDSDPDTYPFIYIGLNTGMRHLEILAMRYEHLDLESHRVWLPDAKAGPRYAYFSACARDYLSKIADGNQWAEGWVFPAASGDGHKSYMKKQFQRTLVRAGLAGRGFTPHTMRHTFITRLVEAGQPQAVVQKLSGHKTPAMVSHYFHPDGAKLVDALGGVHVGE